MELPSRYDRPMSTRGWPIAAVLGIALACASNSDSTPIAEDDLEAEVADGICELRAKCDCAMPLEPDECRTLLESSLRMLFEPSRDAGLQYDADCAGRALAIYDELQCGTIDDLADGDECGSCKIYYGSKQRGEACTRPDAVVFDECAQGSICVGGTCVDPCEMSGIGEPCVGRSCVEGSTCRISIDPETEEQTSECVAQAGLGESCMELTCGDDLVCELSTFVCEPAPGEGEACSGECAGDLWCDTSADDSMAWICRAPQPDGAACTSGSQCTSSTCEGDVCVPPQAFVCFFGGM